MKTFFTYIAAKSRADLAALIRAREALEQGTKRVTILFPVGAPATLTASDLPAIRQKITYTF